MSADVDGSIKSDLTADGVLRLFATSPVAAYALKKLRADLPDGIDSIEIHSEVPDWIDQACELTKIMKTEVDDYKAFKKSKEACVVSVPADSKLAEHLGLVNKKEQP